MKDFDKLCKDFESIDIDTYAAVLTEKAMKLIPALSAFSEDGLSGIEIFASFIYGAIAADGKLSEDEYALVYPLLHAFFGDSIDYNDAKRAFSSLSKEHKELKTIVDEMVDLIGFFSDEMKADIIIVVMLICAVDGKISLKEKNWIKKLIK
ncbi:MAG: TerB family tellurite resistance protein [Spirochaetales bacterium]|nr:TerB family tellurite resistance protein [Spirochaetales bacterium]